MTARYDAVADFYDAGWSDDGDPVIACLLDVLGPVAGQRALDLACGHGRMTRELARRGAVVTGVDLSSRPLEKAEAAEVAAPLGITYAQADAAGDGWLGGEPYDIVVCSFALSDIDDLDGTMANVARAMRPGGRFAFSILHPCFPGSGQVSGAWPSGGRYYDERRWTADGELSALRSQVGANHRMLSTYVNVIRRHGLWIDEMREPEPAADWVAEAARFPVFLVVRCVNGDVRS